MQVFRFCVGIPVTNASPEEITLAPIGAAYLIVARIQAWLLDRSAAALFRALPRPISGSNASTEYALTRPGYRETPIGTISLVDADQQMGAGKKR
jgi:hypothetical protein